MLIQAFGTSNTFGCCGDNIAMDIQKTWPYVLAKQKNVDVENLSCIAITNQEIAIMLDYYIKPNSTVIIELNHPTRPRASISFDGLSSPDNITHLHEELTNKKLVTREIFESGDHPFENNNFPGFYVPIAPSWWNKGWGSPNSINKRVRGHMKERGLEEYTDEAERLAKSASKHWIFSTSFVVDQFALICMMKAICDKHNCNFIFFGWHGDFRGNILPGWQSIIEQHVPYSLLKGVKKSYFNDFSKELWDTETCSCGHQNEVIHEFVAYKLKEIWN